MTSDEVGTISRAVNMPKRDKCRPHRGWDRFARLVIPVGGEVVGWLRALRRPGSIVTAMLVLAAGTLESLDLGGVPSPDWWRDGWQKQVILLVAAAASLASFGVVVAYSLLLGRLHDRERFAALADGVRTIVERETQLARDHILVDIYRVQGPLGFRRLEIVGRAARSSATTHMLWTKSKGVVGFAWKERGSKFADLVDLQGVLPNKAAFCSIPADERFRFSWAEFEATRKYKSVLAVPLLPRVYLRHPVRGILSVTALDATHRLELEGIQNVEEFADIVNTCEAILARTREV